MFWKRLPYFFCNFRRLVCRGAGHAAKDLALPGRLDGKFRIDIVALLGIRLEASSMPS